MTKMLQYQNEISSVFEEQFCNDLDNSKAVINSK